MNRWTVWSTRDARVKQSICWNRSSKDHPRVADLHYYNGYAHVQAGDLWEGIAGYERAMELSHNPDLWLPLSALYMELGQNIHALNAFRQILRRRDNR